MPLAQRDPGSLARRCSEARRGARPILVGLVLMLVGVLVSLSLVHCPKGVAALTHTAASSSSADSIDAGGASASQSAACATADVVVSEDAAHGVRLLLAAPTDVIAFSDRVTRNITNFSRGSPGNVNPLAALDGRSLLYRIGVIRR